MDKKLNLTYIVRLACVLFAGTLLISGYSLADEVTEFCADGTVIEERFEGLETGEIVNTQVDNVSISAINNSNGDDLLNPDTNPNLAIIFDSNNPSGDDFDLGTPNEAHGGPGQGSGGPGTNTKRQDNLLIIAENSFDDEAPFGFVDDPDDEATGGIISFDFDIGVRIGKVTVIDIEGQESLTVKGFDALNNETFSINAHVLGNNSAEKLSIFERGNFETVRMEVDIEGSGAVARFSYCKPKPKPPVCEVLDSGPSIVRLGETFKGTFEISDPDSSAVNLEYIVTPNVPAGAVFDPPAGMPSVPLTGSVQFTPSADDVGKTFRTWVKAIDKEQRNLKGLCDYVFFVGPPEAPLCKVGSPNQASCEAATTSVQLDGTDSVCSFIGPEDPDCELEYEWTTDCPGGSIEDASSASPTITFDSVDANNAPVSCKATLTITDQFGSSSNCEAVVNVEGCEYDCLDNLIVSGTPPAELDDCGVCNGGNEGKDDCGVCFGENQDKDDCGVCFGNNQNKDDCGICFGDNSDKDDCGVCFGENSAKDECSLCFGDGTTCCGVTDLSDLTLRLDGFSARQNAHTQLGISFAKRFAESIGDPLREKRVEFLRELSIALHMDTWVAVSVDIPQQDTQCGISVSCVDISTSEVGTRTLNNSRDTLAILRSLRGNVRKRAKEAGISRRDFRKNPFIKQLRRSLKKVRQVDQMLKQSVENELPAFISSCTNPQGEII